MNRPPRTQRSRRRRRRVAPYVLLAMIGIVIVEIVLLATTEPPRPVADSRRVRVLPDVIPPVLSARSRERSADDVGKSNRSASPAGDPSQRLYRPPRQSDPASTAGLPPGPSMVVHVRGDAIEDWRAVLRFVDRASSPWSPDAIAARAGVATGQIERIAAALFDSDEAAWVIELKQPITLESFEDQTGSSAARTRDGDRVWASNAFDADAFFLSSADVDADAISRISLGSIDRMADVAAIDGESIALPRAVGALWKRSDASADLCLVTYPNFLFADGRELSELLFPGGPDRLRRFLIPDVAGIGLRLDRTGDLLYAEIGLSPAGGISPPGLREKLSAALGGIADRLKLWIAERRVDPVWEPLADRLPAMWRFISVRARLGMIDQTVAANVYLPSSGALQTAAGTLLAAAAPVADAAAPVAPVASPTTIEQWLERPITIAFDQESLSAAAALVAAELVRDAAPGAPPPRIDLIGGDLQKRGITQNQQIRDFDRSATPLREVLTDLVLAANPDRSASGPADARQALVWVIDGNDIRITIRDVAASRGRLPDEFRPRP